jgi:GDP-D-mannose 3', 5'-epimerase
MKRALVCGAGGFIGSHLVKRLKAEGYWVAGVDLKRPEFSASAADEFVVGDLRDPVLVTRIIATGFGEIYQLAADMGGAGYLFTGENDADVMHNSALINLNVLHACIKHKPERVFFSSSACVYPQHNQTDPNAPTTAEDSVYPADPDSDYGWEKLFSERLYSAFGRNYGFAIRIGRFHNIFGPEGTWVGGKEKVPAAMCRKIAEASDNGEIEIWGDGEQTRSFLYIDEALEGVRRLTASDVTTPVNIGSDEMISINGLADMVMGIAGKRVKVQHRPGPLGVRGRNSDNRLIQKLLGWSPNYKLERGMRQTYAWIESQVRAAVR